MNPFAILLDGADPQPFRGLAADSPIQVERDNLALDGRRVRLDTAKTWNPRPDWPAVRQALRADSSSINRMSEAAVEDAPDGSLLDLWRLGSPAGRATFLDRARHCAAELVHGLAASSPEAALDGARSLAGLGGGLTPAGDDFIVGVLLAAWAGMLGPGVEEMGPAVAEAAAPRTTSLSATYLRAAARGECMEGWHRLFAAICGGQEARVRLAINDLLAVGHTSGADALAGFLAADRSLVSASKSATARARSAPTTAPAAWTWR
jgi:hypothetical protein